MPDSNSSAPAVQAHFAALQSNISREAAAATSCKQWCAALVTGVLLALLLEQKSFGVTVLWALAPAALLILLAAQHRARERFWTNSAANFANRLHGRGGKGELRDSELLMLPQPPAGAAGLPTMMVALGSVAVWPFYAGLAAAATMVHMETAPVLARPLVAASGPGAGCGSGGCGSAGGCGNGGCGASSGSACGCSSGSAHAKPAMANFVPQNGPMVFPNGPNGQPKVINARPVINRNALPPNGAAHPVVGAPNAPQGTKSNPIVIPIPASSVKLPNQNPSAGNTAPSASAPQQVPASGSAPASTLPPTASPAPASTPPSSSSVTPSAPPKGN